jgi:hypothetical protein
VSWYVRSGALRMRVWTGPDDGPCETETCLVVVEGHGIGVVKPGTAQEVARKTVFVRIYQVIKYTVAGC